jgi:hypothetical protein
MSHRVSSARRTAPSAGGTIADAAVVDDAVVDAAEAMGEGGHGA